MNQTLISEFGSPIERVENGLKAIASGKGVLVTDNEDRENEGDLIFAAELVDNGQMAMMIRECSGIVCLCLTEERIKALELPMMVQDNKSRFQTAFTVSIEAAEGVTTGVSAGDRVKTIKTAVSDGAKPGDLNSPGHVFPLKASKNGVLEREGHTEAAVDLCRLAGLKPYGVLCELTNEDGTMAKTPEIVEFAKKNSMPVLTIDDIILYRMEKGL